MRQFHHFKDKYPDSILFFRMGDFYETFYEDARTCSRVLGLTLTSRSKDTNPIPLAGIPYHAADNYLKKLLQAGFKVAVCEQVEDPKTARGVVKRDVVRIVTPGTLTDDNMLQAKQDNFLAAVAMGKEGAALAYVDISTGHFFAKTVEESELADEVLRIGPAEILFPDRRGELFEAEQKRITDQIGRLTAAAITYRPGWYFDPYQAAKRLLKNFETATLEGFGLADDDPIIPAAGAVLEYLGETQKTTLCHIRSLRKIEQRNYLQLDPTTLRSLEVLQPLRSESQKATVLAHLDHTLTGMGGRMFRVWLTMPLCDIGAIEARQDAVEELTNQQSALNDVRDLLSDIADIERIAARLSTFRCSPRDLLTLATTLRQIGPLREKMAGFEADLLKKLAGGCDSMDELAELLENAIDSQCAPHLREGGVIRAGFNEELDGLRSIGKTGQDWLARYQAQQIERTGIESLKVGYNRVFGYYIQVTAAAADRVPADYVRKQTLKNAERYITDELKKYETQVLTAEDRAIELEQKLFEDVRSYAAGFVRRLQGLADTVARIDCLASFAYTAVRRHYTRPGITQNKELIISEGKHPVLAETLGSEFVSNDINISDESGILSIITGPNMAGKSTYIRQAALLVLLAQTGSFIPAASATIGLTDRIFTRVGASDELTRGQSTFMVEMTETANILNNATDSSLIILDEVGRGTSTYDGLSLAWAITEYIATKIEARTLFATHYHELTELAELFENIKNYNVAVREWADEVIFLHKILPGGTDKSYGIHVAKLAGVPKSILSRSKEILRDLESTFQAEATNEKLAKNKTRTSIENSLFVQKHKPILDRLADIDPDNLTPIQAINLLNEIKGQLGGE